MTHVKLSSQAPIFKSRRLRHLLSQSHDDSRAKVQYLSTSTGNTGKSKGLP